MPETVENDPPRRWTVEMRSPGAPDAMLIGLTTAITVTVFGRKAEADAMCSYMNRSFATHCQKKGIAVEYLAIAEPHEEVSQPTANAFHEMAKEAGIAIRAIQEVISSVLDEDTQQEKDAAVRVILRKGSEVLTDDDVLNAQFQAGKVRGSSSIDVLKTLLSKKTGVPRENIEVVGLSPEELSSEDKSRLN